jgi:DNA-binding NarL/FixJ family response regulator
MTAPDPATRADPLRVLVVDGDERVRESLTGLLAIGGRLHVVGAAGQPGMALDLALATHPDIVIVDPRLPDVDAGTAFIGRLREIVPDARILAMSWSAQPDPRGIDCGADGFVRKTFRPAELIAAIVANGPAVA